MFGTVDSTKRLLLFPDTSDGLTDNKSGEEANEEDEEEEEEEELVPREGAVE